MDYNLAILHKNTTKVSKKNESVSQGGSRFFARGSYWFQALQGIKKTLFPSNFKRAGKILKKKRPKWRF